MSTALFVSFLFPFHKLTLAVVLALPSALAFLRPLAASAVAGDISPSKVLALRKATATPKAKIGAFREALVEFKDLVAWAILPRGHC